MSKGAATEQALGELHAKVAKVMTNAIVQIEHAQSLYEAMPDEDKQEKGLIDPPALSAPLMGVMTKFLADNSITCAPDASEEVTGLERALANKAKRRRQVGNVTHFVDE
jgi:hypothetical protein